MPKQSSRFACRVCGHETIKWMGRCPGCGEWNTLEEVIVPNGKAGSLRHSRPVVPQRITDIPAQLDIRMPSGIGELDRVLGGGLVPGSLVLLGGDPGIGKSTLLLQVSEALARRGRTVLYVSAEESAAQLRLRSERLGAGDPGIYVVAETDVTVAVQAVDTLRPDCVIVDSIQTVYHPDVPASPGSISQVRECAGLLFKLAKGTGVAAILVGHVTKDGNLAGPRLLEHMVDTVLYFEGERHHAYRMIRAVKNRFGSTNELAIFEMAGDGLREVANPSELLLSERRIQAPGSAVVAAMEGSRPILLEVQALVAPSHFGAPRRMATGADYNRLCLMIAVLERRMGLRLQDADAYLNVAGGVKIEEPAVDLGMALALASSYRDRPLRAGDIYVGEVGLTGEVRSVARLEQRIREAEKLGFARCVAPARSLEGWTYTGRIEVAGVRTLAEALELAL
ncbi:MAG: DNA repair protein RadA [Alicyclobacillaceae bacterium]|nr:DNA repair protein RadA [Alicyclobacillaceae bacterium]